MAKIVLQTDVPATEIADAVTKVDRLILVKRGRDAVGAAKLSHVRDKLLAAAAELKAFDRYDAARCRRLAGLPPLNGDKTC